MDTNILLYAADTNSPDHRICADLLREWRKLSVPWYLTWGIVYEFLRVSTHPKVFRNPMAPVKAWEFVQTLSATPRLKILAETKYHLEALRQLITEQPSIAANLVFDARTVAIMREHGISTIYTHDSDFVQFDGINVIDPIQRR